MSENTTAKKEWAPRRPSLSVYLGPPEVADKRGRALAAIAENMGLNVSKMLQMIADGALVVTGARTVGPTGKGDETNP
jgi:hypothetical protein